MFGPLARKLWRPLPHLSQRIETFRQRHFVGRFVVGVVLQGGAAQFANVLAAINADLRDDRDGIWSTRASLMRHNNNHTTTSEEADEALAKRLLRRQARAAGVLADDALVRGAADVRLFVVSHDHVAMRSVLREYGNAAQLVHYPHRNYTAPGDEGALVDMWLLALSDVVYTTPYSLDTLGALFSHRPYVVQLDGGAKHGIADQQCQPCLSLSGISKARCYNSAMHFPQPPFKCEREYPIF
jgi:hypothetical protein